MNCVLHEIGEKLLSYYLDLYYDSNAISLFIDKFTFDNICKSTSYAYNVCKRALHEARPSYELARDKESSLAVVSFQIMVSNDISANGVYDRIRNEIPYFKNVDNTTLMKEYFEYGQDEIWDSVKTLFKKNGKYILNFPEEVSYGAGRYVRYPNSQQLVKTTEIKEYADVFCKFLQPHLPYTFNEFKRRINFRNNHENESIKRLVFSFYQIWDGYDTEYYKNPRNHNVKILPSKKLRGNRFLETNDQIDSFSIKEQVSNGAIRDVSCSKILSNKKKIVFFRYNADYEDWSPIGVDRLYEECNYCGFLVTREAFRAINNVEGLTIYHKDEFIFGVCTSEDLLKKILGRFNLNYQIQQMEMHLSGGIKLEDGFYAIEAAPVLYFKKPQTEVYVNSNKIKFEHALNYIRIKELIEELKPGNYYIKLPYCAPLKVSFNSFNNNIPNSKLKGWIFNKTSIEICNSEDEFSLIGLNYRITQILDFIKDSKERLFIEHKRKFERFRNRGMINER